ncbi:MAG: hypothetical protein RIS70_2624 [Planctomycetota bacterium]
MSLITRYLLKELLTVFLMGLLALTLVINLVLLAGEAIRQGLGPIPILRLIPYVLPNALRFAIPGTMLFAICAVYGRMAGSNEVVALKSAGIHPWQIIKPGLALAFIVSLAAVVLNDLAASWGRQGAQRVILQSLEQIVYGTLRTHRSYSVNRLSINVKEIDGRRLILPTISIASPENDRSITLTALEAELRSNPERNTLEILMLDSVIEIGDRVRIEYPGQKLHEINLADATKNGEGGTHPADFAMGKIPEEIESQVAEIKRVEQVAAAETAVKLLTGELNGFAAADWQAQSGRLQNATGRLWRLKVEPWRRWANGFSCLFFALVGSPWAIRSKRSDVWSTFLWCFAPILISYYPLMMYGVTQAKAGVLPPAAVWLGNLLLLGLGTLVMMRIRVRLPLLGSLGLGHL